MFQECWQKIWCPGEAELIANQTWQHRVTFFCYTSTHTCTGQTWAVSVWFLPHTWMRGFYHHPSMQQGLMIITVCPGWYLLTTWHNLESLEKKESRLRVFFFSRSDLSVVMSVGNCLACWLMWESSAHCGKCYSLAGWPRLYQRTGWARARGRKPVSILSHASALPSPAVAPPTDGL